MPNVLAERLEQLSAHSRTGSPARHGLGQLIRGIERECLRVDADGTLATTPHPTSLGSALTNANITTDYSEALLELVTPTFGSATEVIQYLDDLHTFIYQNVDDELLWCASMPCIVPDDDRVPIAKYGTANVGMMKEVYRRGLGHRYGRVMQTIAGLHYNVSLPESFWQLDTEIGLLESDSGTRVNETDASYRSRQYFGLVRNVHRYTWLLLYLFGASPAVCKSFLRDRDHDLSDLDQGTLYLPWATSLRMSDLGYQNNAQDGLDVRYNDLASYTASLIKATGTPYPAYEEIGIEVDGEWRQLNANILQIENEYYAPVRPKRVANSGEKPSRALLERGVEYIEIRALDLDPYAYSGVTTQTVQFLDVFTVFCLLEESHTVSDIDQQRNSDNQARVVKSGRDPNTKIDTSDGSKPLLEHAGELLKRMRDVAAVMDDDAGGTSHVDAVDAQIEKITDPDATPSARMLADLRNNGERFNDLALRLSNEHRDAGLRSNVPTERLEALLNQASDSLKAQRALEQSDDLSFGDYLAAYFAR